MKTLLAFAAAAGLALALPSLALAHTGHNGKTTVKKPLLVKPKKLVVAKLNCAKPIVVKGVKQCPTKGASPR